MSYDVSLLADVGGADLVGLDLLDENYTYNVSGMFTSALGHSITTWDNKPARIVLIECQQILSEFNRDPEKFIAMNPANGWGDFKGAKRFIEKIADACGKAPDSVVRID